MKFSDHQTVDVVHDRAENVLCQTSQEVTITARALTRLTDLLSYCSLLNTHADRALFPKGRTYETEIIEAKKDFAFEYRVIPSKVEGDSVIIECRHIRRKSR